MERIRKEIDRFEWKHSWHLKRSEGGTIEWDSEENIKKIRKILHEHLDYANKMKAECEELLSQMAHR
jgi:hypothetical protein